MIELLAGVAIVLVAGYVIAHHHQRIRELAAHVTMGIAASPSVPVVGGSSDDDGTGDDPHPSFRDTDGGGDLGSGTTGDSSAADSSADP